MDTQSSSEATTSTVSSLGCQSIEVTGLGCHLKFAIGPADVFLVSQILKEPSSAPVASSSPTQGDQLSTLTSLAWAFATCTTDFARFFSRTSQIRKDLSELQDANSDCAPSPWRFHWMSSTELSP